VPSKRERKHRNVVGPQVRRIRDFRGWSQSELAAKCQVAGWNVTRDIIATIEGRSRWVGDFEVLLLSRVLSVPVVDLLPSNSAELVYLANSVERRQAHARVRRTLS
jgi:transcriptional regulator with XRE-family HTH domain